MQRGVFYTPRPVVSYIVRSVDELLQTEFGLADGLADTTTWGEMAKRHKRPRRSPRASRPTRPSSRSSTRPPAPAPSSSRSSTSSTSTLVAKWKAAGPRRAADRDAVERLRAEAPAAAPARLRAADGALRHRAPQDRAQALRDRLPLRQRRARADLPHQRARTVA